MLKYKQKNKINSQLKFASILVLTVLLFLGCGVYFNTFFNARKAFNSAEKAREKSKIGRGNTNDYNLAIEKARKVVDNHPNSKYYDDALFILGVSYYQTGQFGRAEKRFRELLANYDDEKFTRESRLYLAKTKLELNEFEEGMDLFEEIFNADYDKEYKAEAAMALGDFRYSNNEFGEARKYFQSVRDSLGNDIQKQEAQMYIADAYFDEFQFGDALGSYIQTLGMDPGPDEQYHALIRAASSSYRLLKIDDGLAYLQQLVDDVQYYDSSSVLKLKVAQGYEYEDDLDAAEAIYQDVAENAENAIHQSEAYYHLGLIYQYDYDDLIQAKDYYDKAVEKARRSQWGQDAQLKSIDIGQIKSFETKFEIDSTTSQAEIDNAAYKLYQLAELYWFQLNKPDSAMNSLRILIDSFPTAYDAPKAMISLSQMHKELVLIEDSVVNSDTIVDSLLRHALAQYPTSDFTPEILDLLGLRGTVADSGYAEYYYSKAEDWLVDHQNYDSARYYYQYVVDNFPDSKLYLQARFNMVFVLENFQSPGDSSVIFAYQEIIDSFPGSDQSREAIKRIGARSSFVRNQESTDQQDDQTQNTMDTLVNTPSDTISTGFVTTQEALFRGPNNDTLTLLSDDPIEIEEPFEVPTEAYSMTEQGFFLYFQILVDFSGEVLDTKLKAPSQYEEVNRLATITVQSMTFDPLKVSDLISRFELKEDPDGRGHWFVYKFLVEKPDFLR